MNGYYQLLADWIPDNGLWQIGLAILPILTGLLGFKIGQRNEREKEKRASNRRRAEFVAQLKGWKAEFQEKIMQIAGYRLNTPAFVQAIPNFISDTEIIRIDLPNGGPAEYDELVLYISKCGHRDFDGGERYQKLCDSIDRLAAIVRPEPVN